MNSLVVKKLNDNGIQYAVIGGIALSFYTEPRFTKVSGEEFLSIDLLVGNNKKYDSIIKNAITEDSKYGIVSVATKKDLVLLKN